MPTPGESRRFTSEQLSVARTIIRVGRSLGASDRDLLVALMTGFQESGLRNLSYGDRDSIGVFQQRNAWGSRAQRMNVAESARMFFQGGHQGQRGLFDFKSRNQMALTQAAQAVQVSAFPDAYAKHEGRARGLLSELGGSLASDVATAKPEQQVQDIESTTSELEDLLRGSVAPMINLDPASSPSMAGIESQNSALSAATMPGLEAGDEQPTTPVGGGVIPEMDSGGGGGFQFPTTDEFTTKFPQSSGGGVDAKRDLMIRTAKSLLGVDYVWGGNGANGVDCSGLVQYALKAAGVKSPRISYQQARMGRRVGLGQLRPGDLVAWDNSSRNPGADHIAIYLGNGQIIEAPRTGLSVRIRSLGDDENYWGVALDY